MTANVSINDVAKALYTINRHAKTAPDSKPLYALKKQIITKLIEDKQAKKIGLHFSKNPKLSQQSSTVLVQVGDYGFHFPATKDDFQNLPHLGSVQANVHNPQVKMSLSQAKRIAYEYLGVKPPLTQKKMVSAYSGYSPYFFTKK